MKTLKDFYIVVTKQNCDELRELLDAKIIHIERSVTFTADNKESWCYGYIENKERVSLSELKRYIVTIPTREALKKAQNASKLHKYRYEQEKKFNEVSVDLLDNYLKEISSLQEKIIKSKSIDNKLTERTNQLAEAKSVLSTIKRMVIIDEYEQGTNIVDWIQDVINERDKWKDLHYEASTNLNFTNDTMDNLRKERKVLVSIAKQDINLGSKTLTEWVTELSRNNEYSKREYKSLVIEKEKEIRKHKLVAMVSLIITLLALGLWI